MSEEELLTENEDQDPEAVRAFLEGEQKRKEVQQKKVEEKATSNTAEEEKTETEDIRINLRSDITFGESHKKSHLADMQVEINEKTHPITDEDKGLYIKATLNDVPVILKITSKVGDIECRTLNVYEYDLVTESLMLYANESKLPSQFWPNIVQQLRAAMQVTKIFGKSVEYARFEFSSDSDREKDARALLEASNRFCNNMNTMRYDIVIKSLNVFEHKITRLQEGIFNKDF